MLHLFLIISEHAPFIPNSLILKTESIAFQFFRLLFKPHQLIKNPPIFHLWGLLQIYTALIYDAGLHGYIWVLTLLWMVLSKFGSFQATVQFSFVLFSGQVPKLILLLSFPQPRHRMRLLATTVLLSAGLIISWDNKCSLVAKSFRL